MRARLAVAMTAGLLALAACGGEEEKPAAGASHRSSTQTPGPTPTTTVAGAGGAQQRRGTKVIVAGSEFGTMLFDSRKQAIYAFERDSNGRTVCYGECAEAWPPVRTVGEPVAGSGVKRGLLGTLDAARRLTAGDLCRQAALLLRPRRTRAGALPQRQPQWGLLVGARAERRAASLSEG